MKRRAFLKGAAVAAPAAVISAPAISQGLREWRMVTSWPKGLPGSGTGAERLAERITKMSDGRLTVKVYAAGELVPATGVFDAVADGTAQLGHDTPTYNTGKSEGTAFFSAFPWGMTAGELNAWIKHGNGQKLWDELYKPFGLRAFLAGNSGTQMFGWFKKEIRSIADLQGLKYRTTGNNFRVLRKLGATPVSLPGGDIFPALQAGAIDGAEYVGPYNDLSLGLYQVCKYYYSHGYQEPGASEELLVNEAAWSGLPNDLKEIVKVAAAAANDDIEAEFNAFSGPALRTLVQEHGVQLRPLPEDVLMALGEKSNEVLNELYEEGNPLMKRIIEDWLKFRSDIIPWTRVGEQTFVNARRLPFEFRLNG